MSRPFSCATAITPPPVELRNTSSARRSSSAGSERWCTSKPARCASSAKSIIMIAFFLTMPISIRMPMVAISVRSVLTQRPG
jgi:hypothetical protein